ncbi:hypothetical protein V6Z11_D13G212200 [Gossypium hirsutum]
MEMLPEVCLPQVPRHWTVSYRFAPDINHWQAEALVAIEDVSFSCNSRGFFRLQF